jgi:hypothetical protein
LEGCGEELRGENFGGAILPSGELVPGQCQGTGRTRQNVFNCINRYIMKFESYEI